MTAESVFNNKSLAFCLLLPTLILYPDLPFWVSATSILFWFYRMVLERSGWRIPSRIVTGFFSVVFLLVTYFSFKTLIGREASNSFFIILLSLKVLEYRQPREKGLLILLGLYLLTSKFLFAADFIWFSLAFPAIIMLFFHLLPEKFRTTNPGGASRFVLKSLLLAAPMTLFLFFYFPRFSSAFLTGSIIAPRTGGVGFADNVSPGSVSSLVENDEVAFRAEFIKSRPTVNTMYWRGLTLTQVNQLHWERDLEADALLLESPPVNKEGPFMRVTIEPNYKQWLFTLDHTLALTSEQMYVQKSPFGVYRTEAPLEHRIVYLIQAQQSPTRPREAREPTIQIKPKPSPKIHEVTQQLSAKAKSPEQLVANISEYLIKNGFQYTLNTGDNEGLTLEDFLFRSRKGFCEHFASSSAILLNLMKVPARVVVGYHGGEYNPIGKFWTISQRDAHAWVEYVDSQNLWHRFDPTAVIAPLRIELGASGYEEAQKEQLTPDMLLAFSSRAANMGLIGSIPYFFENLTYRWNYFFINFDIDKQKDLLRQLDIDLGTAILFGIITTVIFSLSLSWLFRVSPKESRTQKILTLINQTLAEFNLEKRPSEGPLEWKIRVTLALPEKKIKLTAAIDSYIAEAYAGDPSPSNLQRVRQIMRSL